MRTRPFITCLLCVLFASASLPALPARAQAKGDTQPAKAPEGGQKHIYKTVGDAQLPLYVYTPKGHTADDKTPAIVFFFGGGWKTGSPDQFEPHCKYLAERGMVAITVEYRVTSRYDIKIEDCVEDAKSAMRWARANADTLGIDPDRIAAAGGSAGGHLAACTMLIDTCNAKSDDSAVSAKPNAMVLFNPFLGFTPDTEPAARQRPTRGPIDNILPMTYADHKQPPCIMFFGTADRLLRPAELFRDKSVEAGNACRIVTYQGQGHGFFNARREQGKYYKLTVAEMDQFLVGLGWLSEKPRQDEPTDEP